MMSMIFGVDSSVAANVRLTNGYTLYDWVLRQNQFPAFWGRALTGEDAVTSEELAFLKERHCKLALIIRDLTEISVSSNNGMEDALRAVEAAAALGVPAQAGIALFAEIRPDWSVNHNWMMSFAQVVSDNGFLPGFIGNTDSSKNFNFDRQCSHYAQATEADEQFHAVYWATEPKLEDEPKAWAPYCPSALKQDDMGLWQCGVIRFGDWEVNETYAHDATVLDHLW